MTKSQSNGMKVPLPPHLRLRAFAFDPILSKRIDTYDVNEVTIELPWPDNLKLGPVDDYLQVVDYDPTTKVFYAPVDLSDKHLLAQDGLPPSEGTPQFHQQMVYAVARTTIGHFEQALGRRALWSSRLVSKNGGLKNDFVEHLRIYPHALRDANAYYSPHKKALLFGYFPASTTDPGENLPGGTIFTCLSHDVVAHETTHALLDGLHPRFIESTNPDVYALHEGFADIVALFQHFSYPQVLRHQIAHTRGDLETQNLLAKLAHQFGQAVGLYGALRDAIGETDKQTKKWKRKEPDPEEIQHITEPHRRGAILVAAVFDAFLTIYKWRIADLLRIATGGTGVLPPGELHPDLVNRLADEASKTSRHILQLCIRALDYCPPVDVDFGDYLRALITADYDLVRDDRLNYRLAIIEAFRRRGIYPRDVRNLSVESLLWHEPDDDQQKAFRDIFGKPESLSHLVPDWSPTTDRRKIFEQAENSRRLLHKRITSKSALEAARAAKLVLEENVPEAFYRNEEGVPTLEVHSIRPARRIGPDGQTLIELVVEMTQRRCGYYKSEDQKKADSDKNPEPPPPDFIFRGGCTLLVDPQAGRVRYCVFKRIRSENRLERIRRFLTQDVNPSLRATYFGDPRRTYFQHLTDRRWEDGEEGPAIEPFALLHRSFEQKEVL